MFKRSSTHTKTSQRVAVSYQKIPKHEIIAAQSDQKNEAIKELQKQFAEVFWEIDEEEAKPEWENFTAREIEGDAFAMDFFKEHSNHKTSNPSVWGEFEHSQSLEKDRDSNTSTASYRSLPNSEQREESPVKLRGTVKSQTDFSVPNHQDFFPQELGDPVTWAEMKGPQAVSVPRTEKPYQKMEEAPVFRSFESLDFIPSPIRGERPLLQPQQHQPMGQIYSEDQCPLRCPPGPSPIGSWGCPNQRKVQPDVINPFEIEEGIIQMVTQCFLNNTCPSELFNAFDYQEALAFCQFNPKVFSTFAYEHSIFEPVWFYIGKMNRQQGPFCSYDMDV